MAADGADSVHVWKSKVLNVQLKKKVLLLRVWSCRTFTVVSSVLLKQWFSYPLIPSLWWWTGKKKKKSKHRHTFDQKRGKDTFSCTQRKPASQHLVSATTLLRCSVVSSVKWKISFQKNKRFMQLLLPSTISFFIIFFFVQYSQNVHKCACCIWPPAVTPLDKTLTQLHRSLSRCEVWIWIKQAGLTAE